jgi:hypothetical protein
VQPIARGGVVALHGGSRRSKLTTVYFSIYERAFQKAVGHESACNYSGDIRRVAECSECYCPELSDTKYYRH